MKDFVGKLLMVAFACMAVLIAIKFKEVKREYVDLKIQSLTSNSQ